MSGNRESTSNSIKFAPMPMSALIANLMSLQHQSDSPDISFTCADDSDNSFSETIARKITPLKDIKKELFSSASKGSHGKKLTLENKINSKDNDKENCVDNSISNRTYPNHESLSLQSAQKTVISRVYPNSEVKKRGILVPQNNNIRILDSAIKKTPEVSKPPSAQKLKTATPKIKTGIRKFTPGSGKRSKKKTPQKYVEPSRESARCLFKESHKKNEACLPPQTPVPETPVNRKPIPALYNATPSYPQGIVGAHSKVLFKTTNIKGKNYMYIKTLGTGGSSQVYKVLEVGTSCEYAVKCVDLATDHELAQGYINEVRLLRELQNSDRVIRLYDYEYDRANQSLRVVLEVGETDLSSFLRARGAGLPPALVLHYWEEMLLAVNYIHEHGVIHADLKPANFLLVCGRLKLIDFGIASAVAVDATSVVRSQAAGTYSYISPEALMGGAGGAGGGNGYSAGGGTGYSAGGGTGYSAGEAPIKISFRSDVWSLGCILYSMVYGRTPFGHIPNLAKLAAILDPHHVIDYPPADHLPTSLLTSLRWCLRYNARQRPSVRELLAVPYLQPSRSDSGSADRAHSVPRRPLPAALLRKLRTLLPPADYSLLERASLPAD